VIERSRFGVKDWITLAGLDMKNEHWRELNLAQVDRHEVYKDIVRIHESSRGGIKSGKICWLYVSGYGHTVVSVRGLKDCQRSQILMDEAMRERVGLSQNDIGTRIKFHLQEGDWFDTILWMLWATDPAVRLPAWMAFLSLLLGLLAMGLALK